MSDDTQTQATPVVEETPAEPTVETQPEAAPAVEEPTAPETAPANS